MRTRITKLSEHISFCWVFLYSVSKDWKATYKINSVHDKMTPSGSEEAARIPSHADFTRVVY